MGFYDSMAGSIKSAQSNLAKIRAMVEKSNPHTAASFAQTESKESMANEIRANLEYRFYNTSHTMDLIDNFLADRNNNLIEDNEYENTLNASLTNSINDSVTSTKSELEIVNGLIGSLDT